MSGRWRRRWKLAALVALPLVAAFLVGLIVGPPDDARGRGRAGRDPMEGFFPVAMPRYPGAAEAPLAGAVRYGRAPVFLSTFSTADEPSAVGDFYGEAWRRAGLHVVEDVTFAGGTVGAFDPATRMLRQVLMARRDGATLVFPSVTQGPAELLQPDEGGAVPDFPGAWGRFGFRARDGGLTSRMAFYEDGGSLEENEAFFRQQLGGAGWKEQKTEGRGGGPDARVLLYAREGAEVTIHLLRVEPRRTRVHVTEVGL